ncbi:hypothetical protein KSF78_0001839 [Schistosoma japonicum]|nr:hypothetical protein KSF78_0001839 [Schistosoma japonicum]
MMVFNGLVLHGFHWFTISTSQFAQAFRIFNKNMSKKNPSPCSKLKEFSLLEEEKPLQFCPHFSMVICMSPIALELSEGVLPHNFFNHQL